MGDINKTKEQLINELTGLRQRIAELEASEAEYKRVEETLQASEEKYRTLVEEALIGIMNVDVKGSITYVNRTILQGTGYLREELVGKNVFRLGLVSRENIGVLRRRMKEKLLGKPPGLMQIQFRCKNGEWMWLQIRGRALWEHGRPVGVQIIGENITERNQAEEALRLSSTQWQSTFDAISDATCVLDAEGKIQLCNDAMSQLSSKPVSDMIGHICCEFIHGSPKHLEGCPWVSMQNSKSRERAELLVGDKWFEITVDPMLDSDHKLVGAVHVVSDITERKRAEEALRESEEKYRSLFDNMLNGFAYCQILVDENNQPINFIYLEVNDAFGTLTGLRKEDVIGRKVTEAIPGTKEAHPELFSIYGEVALTGEATKFDIYFEPLEIWLTISVYSPQKGYFVAVFDDITERKQAEEALRESESKYSTLIQQARDGVIIAQDGIFQFANQAMVAISGYTIEEIVGKPVGFFSTPENHDKIIQRYRLHISGKGVPHRTENKLQCKDGTIKEIESSSSVIKYRGKPALMAILRDITERKQAEETLRESETFSSSLLSYSPNPILVSNPDTSVRYVNPALEKLTGFTSAELMGRRIPYPWWKKEDLRERTRNFKEAIRHGLERAEKPFQKKNGEPFWVEITSTTIRSNGEFKYYLSNWVDITERKQAEEILRESEERYRALLELGGNVGEAIVMLQDTEQGNAIHVFVSDEWPRMTGYSRKELLGMSFFDLLHSKDREASLERHRRKIRGEIIPGLFEMSIIRKDGTEVPIELTSAYTTYKGERANVAFIRDITERKQAEEREEQLQQELYLTSRLAAVGELAAGVAHELNNPLTGVLGFSERLLRKSTDETVKQSLETIHREAQRAARVVQNLLTFARRRGPAKEHSDINDILQRALELMDYALETGNIEVVTDLAPSLPGVMVDYNQIQEVFLNIILNAEQVMTEANGGGKLTIKTQQMKDCVRTSFTDDGPGIPAEDFDKVFAPFFTTRRERGGTGLGLSVCHGIVTEHGGRIYTKSKAGKGATFFVELPCR